MQDDVFVYTQGFSGGENKSAVNCSESRRPELRSHTRSPRGCPGDLDRERKEPVNGALLV